MVVKKRCEWAISDPIYIKYHDTEWGVPLYDDYKLFEFLVLDGAQAGLSWLTILKKRENYRLAFDNFNPEKIAVYTDRKISRLLADKGIIRNRLKIISAIRNAKAFLAVQEKYNGFSKYIWQFTDGRIIKNRWRLPTDLPAKTKESTAMSKALKQDGFNFVGPVICYAFMQAAGMVNDHFVDCFRYSEV